MDIDVLKEAEQLLLRIYTINKKFGAYIPQEDIFSALDADMNHEKRGEICFLIEDVLIKSLEFLVPAVNKKKYKISAEGFKFLHESFYKLSPSNSVFCALWFNDKTEKLWFQGIEPAVKSANYIARRIDNEHFTEDVIAQMLILINSSKFVIADLTGNRGGVYYEAGYAKARGLPVIFTCKENSMRSDDPPHFDVNHYPILVWNDDSLNEFSNKLYARIINTIL